MSGKLNWDKMKDRFHKSWWPYMQKVIESPEVWELFQFLKSETNRGIKITPESKDLFNSFMVDLNNLNIVVFGQDSYPQAGVASGIAFDCSRTMKNQPSLKILYDAIFDDCYKGRDLNMISDYPDLSYLPEQGVMLTNAALNCPVNDPGKYILRWIPFWKLVFEEVFAHQNGLIFIFMGAKAQYFDRFVSPISQYSFTCEHPMKAGYEKRAMKHDNVFSISRDLVKKNKNIDINWCIELPF